MDLREELLEVVEDVARLSTEHGQRSIVTHRTEGLLASNGHRVEKHVHLGEGEGEGEGEEKEKESER